MVNFWKMTVDVLKDKVKKLELENERLEQENRNLFHRDVELHENINEKLKIINDLLQENKALRLQADIYFDEWQNAKKHIEELEKGGHE